MKQIFSNLKDFLAKLLRKPVFSVVRYNIITGESVKIPSIYADEKHNRAYDEYMRNHFKTDCQKLEDQELKRDNG